MIERFLDPYELKARIAPGLILAFAILVDVAYAAPVLSSLPIFAASGICSLALIYGLGNFARTRGDAIESDLWRSWGGPPSTRFLRYRDSSFGDDLKCSIRNVVATTLSARLLDPSEEGNNPELADKAIWDAFRLVRQYLRQNDPSGLWQKHNIEYGFCRNLLGCRIAWAVLSLVALAFSVISGTRSGAGMINPASAIAALSLTCAVYVGWMVMPDATKRAADAYAESAWMAFARVGQNEQAKSRLVTS
jgi:hypothetical protein